MTVKMAIKLEDNPSLVYSAGEEVKGALHIENDQECTIKGIRIQFSGKARVHFLLGNTHCVSEKEYFNDATYVVGDGTSNSRFPVGEQNIAFNFPLAPYLPSSFMGEHGGIEYAIAAVLERSQESDETTKVALNVNAVLDLNECHPRALQPRAVSKSKNVGLLSCKNGPVSFVFMLSKLAHVPGEAIHFVLELNNDSNRRVTETSVRLIQKIGHHLKQKVLTGFQYVCAAEGPEISAGESVLGSGALQIPSHVRPTRPVGIDIISTEHAIRVTINIDGVSKPLEAEIPVVMGTIPFRSLSSDGSCGSCKQLRNMIVGR